MLNSTTARLLRNVSRVSANGETWTDYYVFSKFDQADFRDVCEEFNLEAHYAGPGCSFARRPYIFGQGKHVTVVIQEGGLDI